MDSAHASREPAARSGGYGLVLLCFGVIAVHVIDDSFVQPQPGTSAGDHLLGGLVPLAILVGAAALYSRARAGVQAIIALIAGFLALSGGIGEAGYYTVKVGPSGDDYTGLLMIAAGVLLLAIGFWTLWTSRRRDDTRRRRYLRRLGIGVLSLIVFLTLVFPVALSYGFTHTARPIVPEADLGAPYEPVSFMTDDGLELVGWYVPSKNGAAVIAFPGRKGPQRPARILAEHGYGVLLFDRRGEGESEGDPNALGWAGDRDLKAAIAYLQTRPDVDPERIGGIGLSVGGELMLQTAAETDALKAVISEGAGIRSAREALLGREPSQLLGLPQWLSITGATTVFSNHAPPPSLKELVGNIAPRPVFLIYAGHGQGGEELSVDYYEAAGEPKTLWEIPEASHTGGIEARPEEYEQRVIAFFDEALQ
jgi:dienelactone hydrolase